MIPKPGQKVVLANVTHVVSKDTKVFDESMGLCSISSFLRRHDYPVALMQFHTQQEPEQVAAALLEKDPGLVGFQPFVNTIDFILGLSRILKNQKPDVSICLGGHFATFNAGDLLQEESLDFIVKGEGERTLLETLDRSRNGGDLSAVPGLFLRKGGKIVETDHRPAIEELDDLPFPARDLLEEQVRAGNRSVSARIITSRGCMRRCSYCSVDSFYRPFSRKKWRGRTVPHIVDEMERIHREYGVIHFNINDSSFEDPDPVGKSRVKDFCREILRRDLHFSIKANFRPESFREQDSETIRLLKASGFDIVFVGAESGSPRELELFRRNNDPDNALRALRLFEGENLFVIIGFIMFTPYTALEDLSRNLEFLERGGKLYSPLYYTNRVVAYRGTHIHERILRDGLFTKEASCKDLFNYRFMDPGVESVWRCVTRVMGNPLVRENRVLLYDLNNVLARAYNPRNRRLLDLVDIRAVKDRLLEIQADVGRIYSSFFSSLIERAGRVTEADLLSGLDEDQLLQAIPPRSSALKGILDRILGTIQTHGLEANDIYFKTWDEF